MAKFDAAGNHVWSKGFAAADAKEVGQSVAVDSQGNVVLVGTINGAVDFGGGPLMGQVEDAFVVKFDAAGNHVWSKRFGDGGTQDANNVAVDSEDNIAFVGHFSGSVDFGGGPLTTSPAGSLGIFAVKLDGAGNHLFSMELSASQPPYAADVAVDAAGNMIVAGAFKGDLTIGADTLVSSGEWDIYMTKLVP